MTKKEEKKSDLEWLLNSLIEKGWKPFGIEWIVKVDMSREHYWIDFENSRWYALASEISPRQLTSKESWLWQFVCENKLFPKNRWHKRENDLWCGVKFYEDEPEYYIIECALLEEWEIEEFLIKNIKIWND
jgi:hypothetical protein